LVTFSTSFVWAATIPLKKRNSATAINSLGFIKEFLEERKDKEIRLAIDSRLSIYTGIGERGILKGLILAKSA
jgi:hypothetical protein